jgi:zinc protease
MLDRTLVPATSSIDSVPFMEPEKRQLSNGVCAYLLATGTQDVVKIDLWFNIGSVDGNQPNQTSSVVDLLREGTHQFSAKAIAEKLDGYGAYLETNTYKERSSVSLYCLSKFAEELVPLLAEIILKPSFPQNEVSNYGSKNAQNLRTELEKVGTLARRAFSSHLFGPAHAYGQISDIADWEALDRQQIADHHKDNFLPSFNRIMISGKIPGTLIDLLDREFGALTVVESGQNVAFPTERETDLIQIEKEGVVQNAIKMGRPLFNRMNKDYVGMQVLTTILGGYFGSRLMSNIREDKGYTYGINAGLQTLNDSGYFMISTEVGSDVCAATLTEIDIELHRLCNELVDTEELNLVVNYLMGQQLKSVDGPFALASKWNGMLNFGISKDDHAKQIRQILNITPSHLMELANQYLRPEKMMTVIAGKI